MKSTTFQGHLTWNLADFTWNLADFTWNLADFSEIHQFHAWKPLNQIIQEKFFTFIECSGEAMSYETCEICRISCLKTLKSDNSREILHFHRVQWGGYVIWNLWNPSDFVTKDHFPGKEKPMFPLGTGDKACSEHAIFSHFW